MEAQIDISITRYMYIMITEYLHQRVSIQVLLWPGFRDVIAVRVAVGQGSNKVLIVSGSSITLRTSSMVYKEW